MKPLRVLQFICPTGFYGAERWVLAFMRNSERKLMENELVVTAEHGSSFQLFDEVTALDLPAHKLEMRSRFDTKAVKQLAKLMQERNIDIIHTHGYKSDLLGLAAAKLAGIKAVCTPHGFENTKDIKLRSFIWAGCQSFRFFDAVVPLSKALMADVLRYGVKSKRAFYIQNGVDLSEIDDVMQSTSKREDQLHSKKIVGFIGQLISRKNVKALLDIFDELAGKHSELVLHLYGDGESRAELEQYAKTLPSSDRIVFFGFIDNRLEKLKHFDLFAMSSSLEGIPRCLMEAMAMRIPVAAYDIPGVDQLISDNETGRLAPLGNKQALYTAFHDQLFDKDKAQSMAGEARAKIEREFSAKRMTDEYYQLFCDLLGSTAKEACAKTSSAKEAA